MSSRAASVLWVALAVAACSLSELDDLSTNSGHTGGLGGSGGSGGVADDAAADVSDAADGAVTDSANDSPDTGAAPCEDYCQALAAACNNQSFAACVQACEDDLELWPRCSSEYASMIQCGADQGTFNCTSNPPLTNCTTERTLFEDCTVYISPLCTVPLVAPSGGSCYPPATGCNPVTNDCPTGETCYYDVFEMLSCGTGTGTETVCEACNEEDGPYCNGGLSCVGALGTQCARYCCTDEDCGGAPGSCMAMGTTDLRFCGEQN